MVITAKNLHFLPVVVFLWFPFTFIVTYGIAVGLRDVTAIFPYISDTGTFSPESCIFGQMLNMGAILLGSVMYIRYRQVKELYEREVFEEIVKKLNQISFWIGELASFGITLVANFQESNIFTVHFIGAFFAFGLGAVYQCLQTVISFKTFPNLGSKRINLTRSILSGTCCLGFVICFLFAGLSLKNFKGDDATKWNTDDGGYNLHLVSTISEWVVALCTMGFILTYAGDFRTIAIVEPEIIVAVDNGKTRNSEKAASITEDLPVSERF